jgi:hypothetical protein
MLPKDFIKILPDPLVDNLDANGQALIDYLASFCGDITTDIFDIWYLKHPEKARAITLDSWGAYLSADLKANDTERQKREKIANAIQRHKLRSTWKYDIKIRIDSLTGKDSQLVKSTVVLEDDDSIIVADNSSENSSFSTIGTDGINEYGMYIPDITFSVLLEPGVVAVDLGLTEDDIFDFQDDDSIIVADNSASNLNYSTIGTNGIDEYGMYIPSGEIAEDIESLLDKIEEELLDSVPAYEKLYLGYIDDDGNFVTLRII